MANRELLKKLQKEEREKRLSEMGSKKAPQKEYYVRKEELEAVKDTLENTTEYLQSIIEEVKKQPPMQLPTVIQKSINIPVSIDQGGTGATTLAQAKTNLGIGDSAWGAITGTLSDQTDLQAELDAKVDENAAIVSATKTKITYDTKGLVTSGADATTADIADSADKRYITDAQQTVLGNTSGTNTGDQTSIVGITGTTAEFNAALSDGDFATGGGTATGTNTGDQTSIVGITGTTAQFNTALTDGDFATLAGSETLSSKTLTAPVWTGLASNTGTGSTSGIQIGSDITLYRQSGAGNARGVITTTGANSLISSSILRNENTGSSAGVGGLLAAGADTAYIGGYGAQRLDAASNSRMALRVLSNGSITSADTSAPIYAEGSASGTIAKLNGSASNYIGTASGIVKTTSGLVSMATAGTDYYAPGSTDIAVADGGTGVSAQPAFHVHKNGTSQTISTGAFAKVTWATESYDTDNCFDSTTNHRFTPTVAGKYIFSAKVLWGAAADQQRTILSIYKNGVENGRIAVTRFSGAGTHSANGSIILEANGTTDYFELYAFHDIGSDTAMNGNSLETYWQGAWLRQ